MTALPTTPSPLEGFQPDQRTTSEQAERQRLIAANERPGLFRAAADTTQGWVTNTLIRQFARIPFSATFDPTWQMTTESMKELGDGIPTEMLRSFESAGSYSDAQMIRLNLLDKMEAQKNLASLGWSGAGLNILSSFLDPAAYAAFAVTGGASGVGSAFRVANLVKGGIVTGATTAGLEAYASTVDPSISTRDILWAGATGFGAHQVFAVGSHGLAKAFERLKKDVEVGDVQFAMGAASGGELNPKTFREQVKAAVKKGGGEHYFRNQVDDEQLQRDVHDLIDNLDMPQDMRTELRALPPGEVMDRLLPPVDYVPPGIKADQPKPEPVATPEGATPAEPPPPPKLRGDFELPDIEPSKAAMTNIRASFAAIFGRSESDAMNLAGQFYVKDSLNRQGGGKSIESASEWIKKTHEIYMARYYREAEPAMRAWADANGKPLNPIRGLATRDEFFEEVGKAIRSPRGTYSDPHINKVANLQRDLHAELLGQAQRHGVKGFEKVAENDNYLQRIWSSGRLTKAEAIFDTKGIEQLFAGAMVAGGHDAETAAKVAPVFLKVIRNLDKYSDVDKARMFSGEQADTLAQVLRENGLDAETVKNIVYSVAPPKSDATATPRAKHRIEIDETYRDPELGIGISDLLESNAEAIFGNYSKQMLGTMGEAEVLRAMGKHFDTTGEGLPLTSYDALRSRIASDMVSRGIHKDRIESDLANLDIVHKAIAGIRLSPNTTTSKVLRTIRSINFLNLSGGFGLAQIPDIGNLVGAAGFKTMVQQIPTLGSIFARAKDGKLSNELLEFIELSTGLGTDRMTRQVVSRFDDAGAMMELGGGGLDRRLRQGTRFANDLSMLAPINTAIQRWSGALAAQKMANIAWSGKVPGAKRLASLGISADEWTTIAQQIKSHGKFEEGWLGHKLLDPNVDGWANQGSASKFIVAIDKWARSTVHQNDIGNLLPFMTSEMGKTIFQFRSFAVGTWEGQLLSRAQHKDWEAAMGAMWGSMLAALAYTGQKYVESIGRADREEYLKKYLATDAIIKAGVQRGSWSSLLPGAVDTVWGATGGDPIFNARNSGLKSNYFTGNPTYNLLVNNIPGALRGVGHAVRGHGYTQSDAQNFMNMTPFRNVIGIKNVFDSIGSNLPKEHDE